MRRSSDTSGRGTTRTLGEARAHAAAALSRLPKRVRGIDPSEPPYPVEISDALQRRRDRVAGRVDGR